jgi:AcrR family transcriptional regulator
VVGRRSAAEATRTKSRILDIAVEQASAAGLTGLTIGLLARSAGLSKAGVVGPFGSRQELQRAVLDEAVARFYADVVMPTADLAAGLPRLAVLADRWIDYVEHGPFAHGCFLSAVSCELAGQPGPLFDRAVEVVSAWRAFLVDQVRAAQACGDLGKHASATDIVTELIGLSMACNQEIHLLHDDSAAARARLLMRGAIDRHRPPKRGSVRTK